jgi:hypothetical protein
MRNALLHTTLISMTSLALVALAGCDRIKVIGSGDIPLANTGDMPMPNGGSGGSGSGGGGSGGWHTGGTDYDLPGYGGSCGGPAVEECPGFEPSDACNPFGAFSVIETGLPDSWAPDGYHGPFDIVITADNCGLPWVDGYLVEFSPATCSVSGEKYLSEDCFEESGQMFCTSVLQRFELNFASTPAKGTVTIWCEGECDFNSTAPIEATPKP